MVRSLSAKSTLMQSAVILTTRQGAHQLVGQAKRHATKIRLEAVGGDIFDSFLQDNSRPEVIGHVIFGVAAG